MPPKRPERQRSETEDSSEAKTRSKSRDQPKINEALAMSHSTDLTAPATGADIMRVLEKLEKIQSDNTHIRTQLTDIKDSFQKQIDKIDNRVTDLEKFTKNANDEVTEDVRSIRTTVQGIEDGINYQGEELPSQKKELTELQKAHTSLESRLKGMEENENSLKKEIEGLLAKNLDMERHVRKYNLLLYGIPETRGEDIDRVVKSFMTDDAKLPEGTVDQIILANAHRLPTKGTGPRPVIVRFVRWMDRELVLGQVYKGILPKGKNILTDLPSAMKAERHHMFKEAYKLRNGPQRYKTRVAELGSKLQLQIRKNNKEPWVNYKM